MKRLDNILFDPHSRKFWANVNGSLVELGRGKNGNGVTKVDTLPEQGEQGKIYYNTSDNKYYIYNGNDYENLGSNDVKRVTYIDSDPGQYTLFPNILYDNCFDWHMAVDESDKRNAMLELYIVDSSNDIASCYTFRTTIPANADSFNITFSPNVKIPDEVNDFISSMEAGHTYEFNIFADVLLVSDITVTDADEDATGIESSDTDGQ